MKVMSIVGARPQFIKLAPISKAISKSSRIDHVVAHSGQHFDDSMSESFFRELGITPPNYNFGLRGLSKTGFLSNFLKEFESVVFAENPDLVLVYGDTNTTLAGAIAADTQGLKLAHLEAGLRSHDLAMPEEKNRRIADLLSGLNLATDENAFDNLVKEGFGKSARVVGDVMLDIWLDSSERSGRSHRPEEKMVLFTLHRESNSNEARIREILGMLEAICEGFVVVWPMHPRLSSKPFIQKILQETNLELNVIEPIGYKDIQALLGLATFVVTDSGGLQKEAYWSGKRTFIPRENSEWPHLRNIGASFLESDLRNLSTKNARKHLVERVVPDLSKFGEGKASEEVVQQMLSYGS